MNLVMITYRAYILWRTPPVADLKKIIPLAHIDGLFERRLLLYEKRVKNIILSGFLEDFLKRSVKTQHAKVDEIGKWIYDSSWFQICVGKTEIVFTKKQILTLRSLSICEIIKESNPTIKYLGLTLDLKIYFFE